MNKCILTILMMSALALAGCNGIAGPDHSNPYLVLKGTITNEEAVATPDNVRVALLWMVPATEENPEGFKVAQETEVNTEFPAFFQLTVDELPPEQAMWDMEEVEEEVFPADTRLALGTVVVYNDGNHNQQLDLIPPDATVSIDTVLGAPMEIVVVFVE